MNLQACKQQRCDAIARMRKVSTPWMDSCYQQCHKEFGLLATLRRWIAR